MRKTQKKGPPREGPFCLRVSGLADGLVEGRIERLQALGHVARQVQTERTATARLKSDGTRSREDLIMFRRAWPWPISETIAALYRWTA